MIFLGGNSATSLLDSMAQIVEREAGFGGTNIFSHD